MSDLIIKSMDVAAIDQVRALEDAAMKMPNVQLKTDHTFHAGVYTRTIFLPTGMMITGALIKIPTVVITSGSLIAYTGEGLKPLEGYHVLQAEAGRKQAFVAGADSYITMIFATNATTIEEAEREFTDEYELLLTNRGET